MINYLQLDFDYIEDTEIARQCSLLKANYTGLGPHNFGRWYSESMGSIGQKSLLGDENELTKFLTYHFYTPCLRIN